MGDAAHTSRARVAGLWTTFGATRAEARRPAPDCEGDDRSITEIPGTYQAGECHPTHFRWLERCHAVPSNSVSCEPCQLAATRFTVQAKVALHTGWALISGFGCLQTLDIYTETDDTEEPSIQEKYLQPWILALLLGATKLTSLSMRSDGIPYTPVLGLLSIRQLELTMNWVKPWLDVITADLSLCSCLETLKISENLDGGWDCESMALPDLFLHDVPTLKSVELLGWYPNRKFTLPQGCLLRLAVILDTRAQWDRWQTKRCPMSMLHLKRMKMRSWPAGLQSMSGLRYLYLHCTRMRDQDLAALQNIPHVSLEFHKFSTFLWTRGSWQSLEIWGRDRGFSIRFSNIDAFVRGTELFSFVCSSQKAGEMYSDVRAACMRQGVACHECEHTEGYPKKVKVARLRNTKLCRVPDIFSSHDGLIHMDEMWPSRAAYPELYS